MSSNGHRYMLIICGVWLGLHALLHLLLFPFLAYTGLRTINHYSPPLMVLSLKTLLCVGCGCFLGGVLRYLTSYYVCTRWGVELPGMPWHTLLINFGGCLFMGLFCGLATAGFVESPNLRLALTAGLCGGYSTLAAFAFENTMILRAGNYLTAGSYIAITIVGSILCFMAGYAAANLVQR